MASILLVSGTHAQRNSRKPTAQAAAVPASLSLRTAMDTDNDGKADFTIFRPRDNFWYTFHSGGTFRSIPWGWAGEDMMAPGDYDGDGIGDVAVWRDTDGVWYILNSSDGSIRYQQWGMNGDEPVARDYDGDGKTDIAVIRRSGGILTWHILGSLVGSVSVPWGLATDFATPGDYDGDGKFDLSVQRPGPTPNSQAVFITLNSGDGSVTNFQWGLSKDLVVPGDYDGDGKVEPWEWLKTCPGFDVHEWMTGGMKALPEHQVDA